MNTLSERLDLRVTADDKAWLLANGGSARVRALIAAARTTQPPPAPTCQHCGRALNCYAYRVQDSQRGQHSFDAWLVLPLPSPLSHDGECYAASRSDALAAITGYQPPVHDVRSVAGDLLAAGQGVEARE